MFPLHVKFVKLPLITLILLELRFAVVLITSPTICILLPSVKVVPPPVELITFPSMDIFVPAVRVG